VAIGKTKATSGLEGYEQGLRRSTEKFSILKLASDERRNT